MQAIGEHLQNRLFEVKIEHNPRNNLEAIKEEIWSELLRNGNRGSRKLFFIKTSKMADYDLLEIRKWARTTDDFVRAFYGACKRWNRRHDGLQ